MPRWKTCDPAARCPCRSICATRITKGAERLGHGKGYEYAHDHPGHFVAQDYLGADKHYYEPTEQGVEKKIKERVEKWRAEFTKIKKNKP